MSLVKCWLLGCLMLGKIGSPTVVNFQPVWAQALDCLNQTKWKNSAAQPSIWCKNQVCCINDPNQLISSNISSDSKCRQSHYSLPTLVVSHGALLALTLCEAGNWRLASDLEVRNFPKCSSRTPPRYDGHMIVDMFDFVFI